MGTPVDGRAGRRRRRQRVRAGLPGQELSRPLPFRTNQVILASVLVLATVTGATMALACLGEADPMTEAIRPPAVTVAAAYWAAVQRRDPVGVRRVLCDEDRLMLAPAQDAKLLAMLLPPGRAVLGFTITGERDTSGPVVTVQVRRSDAGRIHTVTRSTPVTRQAGVFLVCFHRLGLPLGR